MKLLIIIYLVFILAVDQSKCLELKQNKICTSTCLKCENGKCLLCPRGLFTFKNSCYLGCPDNTFADNFSYTCKLLSEEPIYIKAYTKARCLNQCGKKFEECSCNPICKKFGDCCSDYKFCEILEKNHSTDCSIENCKYCTQEQENIQKCLQCEKGFYYFNNQCLLKCPANTIQQEQNKYCQETKDCKEKKNCLDCGNNGFCKKCVNGFFLIGKDCVESCPEGFTADKIDSVCKSSTSKTYHWVFPSKSSCLNKCGSIESDCSCKKNCLNNGNCCDDFEKHCNHEVHNLENKCRLCELCENGKCLKCKPNTIKTENGCICKKDYVVDREKDICVEIKTNQFLKENLKEHFKKNYTVYINDSSVNNDVMKSFLVDSFNIFNLNKGDGTFIEKMNKYLNANATINILENNSDSHIIKHDEEVINSNNNNDSIKNNSNSFNEISKIINEGDVQEYINRGSIINNSGNSRGNPGNMRKEELFNENNKFDFDEQFNALEQQIESDVFGSIFKKSFESFPIHSHYINKKENVNENKKTQLSKNEIEKKIGDINIDSVKNKNYNFDSHLKKVFNLDEKSHYAVPIFPFKSRSRKSNSNSSSNQLIHTENFSKDLALEDRIILSRLEPQKISHKKIKESNKTNNLNENNSLLFNHSYGIIENINTSNRNSSNKTKLSYKNNTQTRNSKFNKKDFHNSYNNSSTESKNIKNKLNSKSVLNSKDFIKTPKNSFKNKLFKTSQKQLNKNLTHALKTLGERTLNKNYIYQNMQNIANNRENDVITEDKTYITNMKGNKNNSLIVNENSNDFKYVEKSDNKTKLEKKYLKLNKKIKNKFNHHEKKMKRKLRTLNEQILYQKINQFLSSKGTMNKKEFKEMFKDLKYNY